MTGEKRLALELLILAALAALCVLAAQYPVLRLEWEARCAVEEEHPGRAERVWRGRVSGSGAGDQAVMVRNPLQAGVGKHQIVLSGQRCCVANSKRNIRVSICRFFHHFRR